MADSRARPNIDKITTGAELKRWYWLKSELVAHARALGVKTTSGKFVILERIAHFLDTGEQCYPGDQPKPVRSKFDWHSEALTSETIITDSYKNTQNVRRFFKQAVGRQFKFNIAFMEWMKSNEGKTLGDACKAFQAMREQERSPGYRTRIKDHNQFNQYTRDFLADNPALKMDDVRRVWALKVRMPSETGRHVYDPDDLKLTDE